MMKSRPAQASTEVVIGASAALLGLIVGIGAAFALWSQLTHTAQPAILTAAVAALAAGLLCIAVAVQSSATRLFLLTAGIALALAFFTGTGAFSSFVS